MKNKTSPVLWNSIARDLLKKEMNSKNLSIEELCNRLENIGIKETKASISNKLSRGSFSAKFFLQAFHAIGGDTIHLPTEILDQIAKVNRSLIKEPSDFHGGDSVIWEGVDLFAYNSFENEWYVDTSKYRRRKSEKAGKVVSLFSGAGGLDLGLEKAGFETVACVEFDSDCKETLRKNRPEWPIVEGENNGDIRKVSVSEILQKSELKPGDATLVVGGAPCQPFSNIGKREGVGDEKNGGDLFQEFVRVVSGVLPKAFIFENVVGITQQKHTEVLRYMQSCFSGLGYGLTYRIMNAADYGVPQKRKRFILMGLRHGITPALPQPTNYKSAETYKEFCLQVGKRPKNKFPLWQTVNDAFSKITTKDLKSSNNVVMNISEKVRNRMELIGPGENFHVLPMDMRPNCWKSGKHQGQDTFGRLRLDEPSVTIRTAAYNPTKGRYIHPTENRGLNTIELAVLQGFPSNWKFCSARYEKVKLTTAGKQIGNAVPIQFAEALGKALHIQLQAIDELGLKKCV
ncbi:DNA (cytosine-5-)-methyltransferase [Kiritimatiellota bacterium B12222]|nr:DNA (cytosine-5-)-methyltransferase [Kiritimatiellota bacterium B12222]